MRKTVGILFFVLALAVPARSQEIFDLLRKGDIPASKASIDKSPPLVEARDRDGDTPLHFAALEGNVELINGFIDKGAKIELQNALLRTPLHLAAMNDRKDAVAGLLKRGAALENRDGHQRTALMLCTRERGQAPAGRVLIEAGADVNVKDLEPRAVPGHDAALVGDMRAHPGD